MKRYTTRQARQHFAELLQAARDGEDVAITAPNQPAVRLVPERLSSLAKFRAWKAMASEIDEDPLAGVREQSAGGRKVRL